MVQRFSLICKLEVIDNAAAWVQQRAAIASQHWKQESWSCSEAVPPVLAPCRPQLRGCLPCLLPSGLNNWSAFGPI